MVLATVRAKNHVERTYPRLWRYRVVACALEGPITVLFQHPPRPSSNTILSSISPGFTSLYILNSLGSSSRQKCIHLDFRTGLVMRLASLPLTLLFSTFYIFCKIAPASSTSSSPSNDPPPEAEGLVRDFFDRNALTSDSLAESESVHTNNWAVLVCASRYWFNYRVRINTCAS